MTHPILITGATGTVGGAVLRRLRDAQVAVRPASRHPGEPDAVAFDFLDRSTWARAFDGVRVVFLVRPPELGNVRRDLVPALEAARVAGVEQVVLLSVQGAGVVPVLPHAVLERWLRRSGMKWTFLRPSYFDQNLSTVFAGDIRDRDEIVVPAGDGRTAFVDAEDVAAVAAVVLRDPGAHAGRVWTPTGAETLTYADVVARLSAELGRPVVYRRPGVLAYLRHARRELGMDVGMAAVTTVIHATARWGLAARRTDDIRIVTGTAPTSFAAFAARERQRWMPPAS